MKISVEELTKGISKFLEFFIFEILDSTTIKRIENEIGSFLESENVDLKFSEYDIRTTIYDSHSLKVSIQFDDNIIDFYLGST